MLCTAAKTFRRNAGVIVAYSYMYVNSYKMSLQFCLFIVKKYAYLIDFNTKTNKNMSRISSAAAVRPSALFLCGFVK